MTKLRDKFGSPEKVAQYKNSVRTLQEGGQMAAPAPEAQGAPAQGGGEEQLMAMIEAYKAQPSPELAVQIADTLVSMVPDQGAAPQAPQGDVGMAKNGGTMPGKRVFRK